MTTITQQLAAVLRRQDAYYPLTSEARSVLARFDAAQPCDCGKKLAAECEKWEPGCMLSTDPEHAKAVRLDLDAAREKVAASGSPSLGELRERLAGTPDVSGEVRTTGYITQAAGEQPLPPLPETGLAEVRNTHTNEGAISETGTAYWGSNWREVRKLYTADQMHAYARAAQAVQPLPVQEGWKFNHARQQKDDEGSVDGVWEIGFLDPEDDRFSPIVTVDTGLYYQDKEAEPLARAILARLTTSHVPVQVSDAIPQPLPVPDAPTATEEQDLDAWECPDCGGRGKRTVYHKVTHQLGTDELPFWEACETCDGIGYCGPDAEKRAAMSKPPVQVSATTPQPAPGAQQAKPPKHRFWGAGEADCPADIKAPNGELHSLRCKVCGQTNPPDQFCWAVAPQPAPAPEAANDDVRELRKWLNEEPNRTIDRQALARVLAATPPAPEAAKGVPAGSAAYVLSALRRFRQEVEKVQTMLDSVGHECEQAAMLAATPPAPDAQQGEPTFTLPSDKFVWRRIEARIAEAGLQETVELNEAMHKLADDVLVAVLPTAPQPAQAVPLSDEAAFQLASEYFNSAWYSRVAVGVVRATERACAEAWGVKLAGGGEGV